MLRYRVCLLIVIVFLALPIISVGAETWRIDGQEGLREISNEEDRYLLAVTKVKQLALSGETGKLNKAIKELKKEYPQLAGEDFDAFAKAEILFSNGKFTKAAKAYERFVRDYPESSLYQAVLDRQFLVATAFLGGQKKSILKVFKIRGYAEGSKMMNRIEDRSGDDTIGQKASLAVARSYEKRRKYDMAYERWSQIYASKPDAETSQMALMAMARCKHRAYKGPKYDVSYLVSSRSYYQEYKSKYPVDAGKIGVGKRLEQIQGQLAYKFFCIGEYYRLADNVEPANMYYRVVVEQLPTTTAAEMAEFAIEQQENPTVKKEKKKWRRIFVEKIDWLFLRPW